MIRIAALLVSLTLVCPAIAAAQTDEIQVYDGGLAPVGVFNLTVHNNYTPDGIKEPAYPGAVTSHKSWNGVPEWAYGVTEWFEAGLYLPLYTHDQDLGWKIDGFKLRSLFAVPHADERRFFYGANFEFSINAEHWDEHRFASEVRPIVGWHLPRFDVIINPIVDTDYDGLGNLEFVPAARIAYNYSPTWAFSVEHYADFGHVSNFESLNNQSHQVYGVVDYVGPFELQFGVGFGLTDASDKLTFKVIFARDLNKQPKR